MKRGKIIAGLTLGIFLIVAFSIIVSAEPIKISELPDILTKILKVVFGDLDEFEIGDVSYTVDKILLSKVLLSVILFALLWSVLSNMPFLNVGWPKTITSIIITILSVRLITSEWITAILIPYGALGIAITAILPFIIYFWFVETGLQSSNGRRLAWIFFIVIFCALWFDRVFVFAENQIKLESPAAWIYPITCLVALIVMWADKTIHAWFVTSTYRRLQDAAKASSVNEINNSISWASRVIATPVGNALPPYAGPGTAPPWYAAGGVKTAAMNGQASAFIKEQEKAIRRILKS